MPHQRPLHPSPHLDPRAALERAQKAAAARYAAEQQAIHTVLATVTTAPVVAVWRPVVAVRGGVS